MVKANTGTPLRINNRDARRLWLGANSLADAPTGPLDVMALIKRLGFVQIDTIRNVTRAHHHILWSRNQNYREEMLWPKLGKTGELFEHFTHDASLIPMDFYPMWQRQFSRMEEKVSQGSWHNSKLGRDQIEAIRERIRAEGPLSTHAFDTKINGKRVMWARPPHKKALDQMWYGGVLATAYRDKFIKFYDLGERVFPMLGAADKFSEREQIDWLCAQALERLSFASIGQLQRFWGATDTGEVKRWVEENNLVTVEIEADDKSWFVAYAPTDIEERLASARPTTKRLRLLNPFDPAIRDRLRLKKLFGFDYRNEMFVPKVKRVWGYYVYPLLEGDRFVGRIEISADRGKNLMQVTGFWVEPGVKWTSARHARLQSELTRFGVLAGISTINWQVVKPV